jgi:hypothetical protein
LLLNAHVIYQHSVKQAHAISVERPQYLLSFCQEQVRHISIRRLRLVVRRNLLLKLHHVLRSPLRCRRSLCL